MYEPMSESYEILIIRINVIIITIFAILAILVTTINTIIAKITNNYNPDNTADNLVIIIKRKQNQNTHTIIIVVRTLMHRIFIRL